MEAGAATRPLRVLTLGDSITRGSGDPAFNGWRKPFKDRVEMNGHQIDFVGSQTAGTMIDRQHEGHGGWTIGQVASIAPARVRTYRPDVVLLMVGTNDLLRGRFPSQRALWSGMPARLEHLVRSIRAAKPGVVVLLSSVPQIRTTDRGLIAAWNAYRDAVPGVAARTGARWVAGHRIVNATDISPDGVHPGACGYRKFAFLWFMAWTQQFPRPAGRAGWDPGVLPGPCHCNS